MNSDTFLSEFNTGVRASNLDDVNDVMRIISGVQSDGDAALREYTSKFDGRELSGFKVPEEVLTDSLDALPDDERQALESIISRIESYQESIKYSGRDDGEFKYVYHPLEKVGVYIPGGTAIYPSSVLMTVVPALAAGVKEIHVVTPTFNTNNMTFAALASLGVTNVYTVGGAQAIAALAFGTETVPKVDKIVGPGNKYVALAKKLVFGEVGIDMLAGPSEILLYADDTADATHLAYDIFAQAEHDVNARTFLVAENEEVIERVQQEIDQLADQQERSDIIRDSLKHNHYQVVDTREKLIHLINTIAPEHVSVQHRAEEMIAYNIKYAGAVFCGKYSPEAVGDYAAGPSHVLPTDRTGRFSHGLNVNDFLTSHAVINLSRGTFKDIVRPAGLLAQKEGLDAHYQSLNKRTE